MAKFDDITVRISDEDRQRFDRLIESIQWLREHVSSEQPPSEIETICIACMQIPKQCKCPVPHLGLRVTGHAPTITTISINPEQPGD